MTELEETISRCFYGMLPSLSLYCGSVLFNVYMDFRRKELRAKSAKPPTGRVSKVTARLGEHINSITFHFSDDTSVTYGTEVISFGFGLMHSFILFVVGEATLLRSVSFLSFILVCK